MSTRPTPRCRGCRSTELAPAVELGAVPAADHFPRAESSISAGESAHPLQMDMCTVCGLAQLADDDTAAREPRGIEPQALRDQAADAIARVGRAGLLRGGTVREFGSPHGGSWLPLLPARGFRVTAGSPADLVLDSFGIMHEPDQRNAFLVRAGATAPDGLLLLQYHPLATIVSARQWNALRHGHYAYYSLATLQRLLHNAGLSVLTAWEFDLYGGTVLLAAVHRRVAPDARVRAILAAEAPHSTLAAVRQLQSAADRHALALRSWLEANARRRVYAYGAASRAVALFSLAGAHHGLITAVADASPAKHGRRMPGTDIPIISPTELSVAAPDLVLLTLPDLLPEVRARFPELGDRLVVDTPDGPTPGG